MTVKELKEKLNDFDENLEIGGIGHYQDYLEIEEIRTIGDLSGRWVAIEIEWAGDEPD